MNDAFYLSKKIIEDNLKVSPLAGKRLLEPLKSMARELNLPFNILEDCSVENEAEVHIDEGDLWYCLEGEANFCYGGELDNPVNRLNTDGTKNIKELRADTISGGKIEVLKPGDWLWIPAGVPHLHSAKDLCRLMIIKIPVKK